MGRIIFQIQVFKVAFHCTKAFSVKHKLLSLLYIHLESNQVSLERLLWKRRIGFLRLKETSRPPAMENVI